MGINDSLPVHFVSPSPGFTWHVGDEVSVICTADGAPDVNVVYNVGVEDPLEYGAASEVLGVWTRTHTVLATEVGRAVVLAIFAANDGSVGAAVVEGTVADTTAPTMTAFAVPYASNSRTVTFTTPPAATDSVGVTGFIVTENATTPSLSDPGWSATPQTGHTFTSDGVKVLYARARDAAGNISAAMSATVIVDTGSTAPEITEFTVPATSSTYRIPITTFTATDDVAPAYYLVERRAGASPVTPSTTDPRWQRTVPAAYTANQNGEIVLDAWAMDANHNISASASDTCTVDVQNTEVALPWAGGWVVGGEMHPNGDALGRLDTYGVVIWRDGDTQWRQLTTASSMPEGYLNGWDQYTPEGTYAATFDNRDANANTIWVVIQSQVFVTTNGGTNWINANLPNAGRCEPNDAYRMNGGKIKVDPANSDVVAVGTQVGGLYLRASGGTWTHTSVPSGGAGGITGICFGTDVSGGRTQTIFCASWGQGVYRSTDAGTTWTQLTGGPATVVWADYVNGIFYASSGNAIWMYASATWTRIAQLDNSVHSFHVINANRILAVRPSGHFYVITRSNGVWSTASDWMADAYSPTDIGWLYNSIPHGAGQAWFSVGATYPDRYVADRYWMTAGCGVWYCDLPTPFTGNEQYYWHSQSLGIGNLVTTAIISPEMGWVLSFHQDRPVVVINNIPTALPDHIGPLEDGRTRAAWGYCSTPNDTVVGVIANMNGGSGSSYSLTGGHTWSLFPSWPGGDDSNGGCIAACSRDDWVVVKGCYNYQYVLQDATNIHVSHDRGLTWTPITIAGVPTTGETGWPSIYFVNHQILATDRVNTDTVYALNYLYGVYRSTDRGDNWTRMHEGPLWGTAADRVSMWNTKLLAVPGNAGHLFACPGPMGVQGDPHPYDYPLQRSTNGGATWTPLANVQEVHCMGFGKHAPGETYPTIVLAGWVDGQYGVWRSTDNCVSWEQISRWPCGYFDYLKGISGDLFVYGRYFAGFNGTGCAMITTADAETVTTHTILSTSGRNGQIFPGAARVVDGTHQTFDLTPNTGYHLLTLTVDGNPVTVTDPPQTQYEFADVTADHTIATTWLVDVDTEPPTVPGNLTAQATSSTEVSLAWDPSADNVGVTGYAIWVDGVRTYTTTNTSYPVTGLEANTEYDFQVSAYDASDNESDPCAIVSETTLASGQNAVVITSRAHPDILDRGYSSQTATFSAVSIGTAFTGRVVAVTVSHTNGAAATISSVTIGGEDAEIAVGTTQLHESIWYLTVETGTTADIVITCTGGTLSLIGIQVCTLANAAQTGPDSYAVHQRAAAADPQTLNLSVSTAGGAVIGAQADSNTTPTWTNVTGDSSSAVSGLTAMLAHTNTEGSVTASLTGANYTGFSMCSASWAPA